MRLRLRNLSIRAKLAVILGVTIFSLAATRALGLTQLGVFLDRFVAYTTVLENLHDAQAALTAAQLGVTRERFAADGEAAQAADRALERLAQVAPRAGLPVADVEALRQARRAQSGQSLAAQTDALQALAQRIDSRFEAQRGIAADAYAVEYKIMNGTYVSMLLLVLAVGLVAYFLIAKMVTRPLNRMVSVANAVAAGDLRSRIDPSGRDELSQVMRALGEMNTGLAQLIGEVRDAAGAISGGSGQIDQANAKLAERFADQAAGLDHAAATMEHLTATVGRNAEHARRAADRAGNASVVADRGGAEVRRAVETMSAVDAGARRITDIVGVIDSIAFQTNILALNAAVEAARAGAQGRGFAVVASEVRSLAQKSAAAAREIKTLIGEAISRVEEGGRVVQAAGDTIAQTVSAVQEVTGIVGEIAALSNEQAARLQEMNHEVADLVQKTRGNTVLVNHAADAARANSEQAVALQEAIAVFRLAEGAAAPAPPPGGPSVRRLEGAEPLALGSRG
ncbi:MAG TPA: methyl-accepting chemotaxis protein [Burkholderiales bacterium]|nr:methyl-accepting chemotaxis protein [Burkholderiales bacterium]